MNEYRIVGKNMNGADYLGDICVDGMIILKSTSEKKAQVLAEFNSGCSSLTGS
jgi:hypothetical protein